MKIIIFNYTIKNQGYFGAFCAFNLKNNKTARIRGSPECSDCLLRFMEQ